MRDEETGSYWQQVTGGAIAGPLKGQHLTLLPQDELSFGLWKKWQPSGTVLAPLSVYASKEVMQLLVDNVFNGIVWPDFTKLISPLTHAPAVVYRPMTPGKKVMIGDTGLTAVNVHHLIPAAGVIVEMNGQAITFTGDTVPTSEIWKRTNKTPNVVAIVTEASFPNDQQSLADETAHLSPDTFGDELKKITVDAPVYASHRKIPFERDIESQIRNLRDRRARVLLEKNYTL